MKILAINGSPRGTESSSREVISQIRSFIPEETDWEIVSSKNNQFDPDMTKKDVWLITYPLYVDGLPASLMRFLSAALETLSQQKNRGKNRPAVFAVANCGFYEPEQNAISLDILKNFCIAAGLRWCGGAGIGTGEMIRQIKKVPPEAGIKKKITRAFKTLAASIAEKDGKLPGNIFARHSFPRFLYTIAGNASWKKQIKKNGGKTRDIQNRPLL